MNRTCVKCGRQVSSPYCPYCSSPTAGLEAKNESPEASVPDTQKDLSDPLCIVCGEPTAGIAWGDSTATRGSMLCGSCLCPFHLACLKSDQLAHGADHCPKCGADVYSYRVVATALFTGSCDKCGRADELSCCQRVTFTQAGALPTYSVYGKPKMLCKKCKIQFDLETNRINQATSYLPLVTFLVWLVIILVLVFLWPTRR
jgi:hypothetical protein